MCDIPSGCCSFMGPWTVTRSSLRMLRRVAAFCRPLRPVLLLVPPPPPPGVIWFNDYSPRLAASGSTHCTRKHAFTQSNKHLIPSAAK